MEKKILFLVAFFIFQNISKIIGQADFFKPGSEWYYSFVSYSLLQARGYTVYQYAGDTIIDTHLLKKLNRTTYYFDYNEPTIPLDTVASSPRYFKQSGDSILSYYNGDLKLLWILGLEAGDQFQIEDWETYTMHVDSTKDIIVDGIAVNKSWIHGGVYQIFWGDTLLTNRSGKEIIYDKFGPEGGFFYYSCWGFYDCYTPSLCKYKNDEIGEVNIPGYHCENLLSASNEIVPSEVIIMPNPFSDIFNIYIPDNPAHYVIADIYNSVGFPLLSTEIHAGVNQIAELGNLPVGMFFIRISNGDHSRVFPIIKQ